MMHREGTGLLGLEAFVKVTNYGNDNYLVRSQCLVSGDRQRDDVGRSIFERFANSAD